jgi:hypothetical protein
MSRYIMIRRLRWPAILVLAGVVALLDQLGAIDRFWHWFIPLLLILFGVLLLAERAALNIEGYPPYPGVYPGTNYGAGDPLAAAAQPPAATGSAIVPAHEHDFDNENDRGQS